METIVDQIIGESGRYETILSDSQVIDILALSKEPIVLWGFGLYAEYIYKILQKHHLRIDAVFADGPIQNARFHDYPVCSFEDVQQQFSRFIIVRGNGNLMREAEYRQKEGVLALYSFFDLMGFGWHLTPSALKAMAPSLDLLYRSLSDKKSKESFFAYLNARYMGSWIFIQEHFCPDMYFPEFLQLRPDEVFVDCGAYDGDTFRAFQARVPTWDTYIAFEPAAEPLRVFESCVSGTKLTGKVQVYDLGIWSHQTKLTFIEENDVSRIVESETDVSGTVVSVTTIDHVCKGMNVSYIKMDLEGSEMEALKGAQNIIAANKPKLAVSLYHKQSHLVEIFDYLRQLNPSYKFYFRIHTKVGSDAVLYAI
jgi:FkbM family methyltransferase